MLVAHPILVNDAEVGVLSGAFDLSELIADSARFTDEITITEVLTS